MNRKTTRPAWATPGLSDTPIQAYERAAARLAGVPETRRALFAYSLTGPGIARLWSLLESGHYEIHAPEEAALLCLAWLLRADDVAAAAELAVLLEPFADRMPFTPRPTDRPGAEAGSVHVRTVGEATRLLAQRRPNPAVAAQREALTVWRPFEDELLAHWLRGADATRTEAAELLERYEALAAEHPLTARHRNPKSNCAILLRALTETVAGRELPPRLAGLLRHAVASMVAKRGRPGSPEHTRLRREQARQAARPAHHELAELVRDRLARLDPDSGLADVERPLAPVTAEEARESGLPAGAPVPPSVRAVVCATLCAPLETLLERGVVPSAEVLAELAPQLVSTHAAPGYADGPLRTLMTAVYRSRAGRRYPLWWSPELHHTITALPWVHAVSAGNADRTDHVGATLRGLGELAVRAFPGSGPSNLLMHQLPALARLAALPNPFLCEPFVDSYSGAVEAQVLTAAGTAAELLAGTTYERYYGIDFAALGKLVRADDRTGFTQLCAERAGLPPQSLIRAHPEMVEQVRILTTLNLATLVHEVGIAPQAGWDALARGAFTSAHRRSATPKRLARAWRNLVFHLSLCDADRQEAVLDWIDAETPRLPAGTAARLAPLIARTRRAAAS